MSAEEEKRASYKKLVVGVIVVTVILTILFVPMIPVEVAYSVPHFETYNETVPYNRSAKYQDISYSFVEHWDLSRGYYHLSQVVVKNIDAYGGNFTVIHYLYDSAGLCGKETTSGYVEAGKTQTFVAAFDTEMAQSVAGTYSVFPPTIIDQKIVTLPRTVYVTENRTIHTSIFGFLMYH